MYLPTVHGTYVCTYLVLRTYVVSASSVDRKRVSGRAGRLGGDTNGFYKLCGMAIFSALIVMGF